jgi:hypothetical protein
MDDMIDIMPSNHHHISVEDMDEGVLVYIDDDAAVIVESTIKLANLSPGDTATVRFGKGVDSVARRAHNLTAMRLDLSDILRIAGFRREIADSIAKELKPTELVRLHPIEMSRTLEIICLLSERISTSAVT